MDPDMMYDEFGNYVGPELESDDEEGDDSPDEQEVKLKSYIMISRVFLNKLIHFWFDIKIKIKFLSWWCDRAFWDDLTL